MRVAELTGSQLDLWVARANGWTFGPPHKKHGWDVWRDANGEIVGIIPAHAFNPSTDWDHGGPIIERERIDINTTVEGWEAYCDIRQTVRGDTALEAAMRAYVTSKFGDVVQGGSGSNG